MTRAANSPPTHAGQPDHSVWTRPDAQLLLLEWEHRFLTRRQPYARQQGDGSYRWDFRRLDRLALLAHLQGKETLALSSTDELGQCRWVCLDADAPDGLCQLQLVQHTLSEYGLPSLLERSRRGGHLWLFFTLPQPAALATGVARAVLEPLYATGQLQRVLEVYPDNSETGQLGHAVRMPLGVHRRTMQRYPFVARDGTPIELEDLPAAMAFAMSQQAIRPEQLRAVAGQMGTLRITGSTPSVSSSASQALPSSTTSAVIRWVDTQVSPLDLLEELASATDMRLAGHGYLGWCPFHDDQAPDVDGSPGTPSFYVVHNSRYGWSWRCLSSNCAHSDGPMRHSFRLFQELLQLDVVGAIGAALVRWPEAGSTNGKYREDERDADATDDPAPDR
jgi:TOTE conflict system, Archaeo-Eukaryotic Primase domain